MVQSGHPRYLKPVKSGWQLSWQVASFSSLAGADINVDADQDIKNKFT